MVDSAQLTEAGLKRMRTRSACQQCKSHKARCSGTKPCDRCQTRGERCLWASEHDSGYDSQMQSSIGQSSEAAGYSPTQLDANAILSDVFDSQHYIELYFDKANPSTIVFLHKPTVLADWSQGRLTSALTILLCGMGVFHGVSSDQRAKARDCIRSSQLAILSRIGEQSIEHLQTLVLLVQFHFRYGNIAEAWDLISLAARLAFTLRLNYEHQGIRPLAQESQRRLVWAIYQIDRMLSGGVEDLSVCPVDRMFIRLPCDDQSFHRGMPSRAAYLDSLGGIDGATVDALAYHLQLKAIRDRVLRYVTAISASRN